MGKNIDVSSSSRSDLKVQVEHRSPATNAVNPKTSAKKSNQKKGYVIETIDASGKVVMENGINIPATNELKVEKITPNSLSKYGRKIFPVNGLSKKEEKTPAKLPSSEVVHQSSFGRNIRKTPDKPDFSYNTKDISQTKRTKAIKSESQNPSNKKPSPSTSGNKRSRKQLDIGMDTSMDTTSIYKSSSDLEIQEEVNLINKSLIAQEGISSPPSKKAKRETSPTEIKSPRVTLSQNKNKKEDAATPNQGKKQSDLNGQLAVVNGESGRAGIFTKLKIPVAENLDEAFPSQGNFLHIKIIKKSNIRQNRGLYFH